MVLHLARHAGGASSINGPIGDSVVRWSGELLALVNNHAVTRVLIEHLPFAWVLGVNDLAPKLPIPKCLQASKTMQALYQRQLSPMTRVMVMARLL